MEGLFNGKSWDWTPEKLSLIGFLWIRSDFELRVSTSQGPHEVLITPFITTEKRKSIQNFRHPNPAQGFPPTFSMIVSRAEERVVRLPQIPPLTSLKFDKVLWQVLSIALARFPFEICWRELWTRPACSLPKVVGNRGCGIQSRLIHRAFG
jgi:hypothetical protein